MSEINYWSSLVEVNRLYSKDENIILKANMLFRHMNTAGGIHLIKYEIENFFNEIGYTPKYF